MFSAHPETDAVRGDHFTRITDSYGCMGVLQLCPRELLFYFVNGLEETNLIFNFPVHRLSAIVML